jgi:superoxide dismutase, Cu-Zn family
MKTKRTNLIFLLMVAFGLISFGQDNHQMMMEQTKTGSVQKAICVLYPTRGNDTYGTITFTHAEGGVKVVLDMKGLTKGLHGFHIHEFGDCSTDDGTSAGGHYNPAMKSHGGPADMERHAGDMGNFEADAAGNAHLEYVDKVMTLEGKNSIIGRSVIVHKNADDMKSQPAGNSGPRIACGVIGIAK